MLAITCDFAPAARQFKTTMRDYRTLVEQQGDAAMRTILTTIGAVMDTTAPVDTGALRANRSPVRRVGRLTYATGYTLPYAPVLEYGGYRGVGPKTVELGGGAIDEEFIAGAGIYSRQAPLGWVRKALAQARPLLAPTILDLVQRGWSGGGGQVDPGRTR